MMALATTCAGFLAYVVVVRGIRFAYARKPAAEHAGDKEHVKQLGYFEAEHST